MPPRKKVKPFQEVVVDWVVEAASAKADELLTDLGATLKRRLNAGTAAKRPLDWSHAGHVMADLIDGQGAKKSDPFSLLGIAPGASPEEIHKAFRAKAKQFHPDLPGGNAERFQEVLEAYRTLGGT